MFVKLSEEFSAPFSANRRLLSLVLVVACLGFNVYLRLTPAYFPQLRERAVGNVMKRLLLKEMHSRVSKDPRGDGREVSERLQRTPESLDKRVDAEYQKLKDPHQAPDGQTYFLDTDSFTWVQYTRDVLRHGYPGDKKVNGKSYDSYTLAPIGSVVGRFPFLFYASAFLYKTFSLFVVMPLETFLFYIPVFYAFIFLLTLYAFVKRWSTDLSASLAVFLTGMSVFFLFRTSAGWYDTDALNVFFPLAITGSLLEALSAGAFKLRWLFFTALAAFFQGVFMTAWMGWWFISLILAAFFLLCSASTILRRFREPGRLLKEVLSYGITAAVFFVFSDLFGYLFTGTHLMASVSNWARSLYPQLGSSLSANIWPNPLYTVSELSPLRLQDLAAFFYHKGFFWTAVAGLCIMVWKERSGKRREVTLMMFCWVIFLTAASLKSQRFVFFLSVPVFFFLGVFFGDLLPAWFSHMAMGWKRLSVTLAFVLALIFLVVTAGKTGVATAERVYPMMSDSWYKALTYVDQHTLREAILNSWWDYGSWFKYYGKRRVIFDPQTQEGQLSYWMARVLLEKDEARALAILRMLNNASGKTYNELSSAIGKPYFCEVLLEQLLGTDRQQGERILKEQRVPSGIAQKVLDHLHAKPAPAYFIVDGMMVKKIPNISFLGNWDFSKAFAYAHRHEARGKILTVLETDFGLDPLRAEKVAEATALTGRGKAGNERFSNRYSFVPITRTERKEEQRNPSGNQLVSNHASKDVRFFNPLERKYFCPRRVVAYDNGAVRESFNDKSDLPKTALLIRGQRGEQSFIADDPLATSLIVKLYFMKGAGLKYFKPFYSDDKNGIYIYEIVWGPA